VTLTPLKYDDRTTRSSHPAIRNPLPHSGLVQQDGGVVKADASDVFLFEAPATGYTKSIKFRYGPEGADEMRDGPGAPVRFCVRSDGGRSYGAGETAFFTPHDDGVVFTSWRSWRNPNGSRNLEHDAANPWLVGEDKP